MDLSYNIAHKWVDLVKQPNNYYILTFVDYN